MNREAFCHTCREHGIKVTPQRTAIYEIVTGMKDHPSATDVYDIVRKRFPNISFDTVNRTLLSFVDIGLLCRVPGSGEVRRFDLNLNPHHHARCVACNRIIDIAAPELDHLPVPESIRQHRVAGHKVVFDIVCDHCLEQDGTHGGNHQAG